MRCHLPALPSTGSERFRQGYRAAMLVEESRMKNLAFIDYSVLLLGVMTIADEVDLQLSQAMQSFSEDSLSETRTAGA
jgi:hypothetical protein